jgi:hypothetical protein
MIGKPVGEPGMAEILRTAIRARQSDIRTACPGIVVDYDPAAQTVSAKLAVNIPDTNGVPFEAPILTDVPVLWQRGGGFFASMPLDAGDVGLLVFSEMDFSGWRQTGQVSDVVQERRHGLYAYFLPGGCVDAGSPQAAPLTGASGDYMVCGKDGGPVIKIKADGIELGESASGYVALASKVNAELTAIANAFSTFVPGTGGASFPSAYTSAGDVAATKVKAE